MKILLCTNSFENVVNGPAKFANLILEINQLYPQHQIHILTEDITAERPYVHKAELRFSRLFKPFSQFLRMFVYHRYAQKIYKTFPYDVLVYNNAFIGLWSAMVSKQPVVGMVNDDNNLTVSWQNFKFNQLSIKQLIFKQFEKLAVHFDQLVISNSHYLTQQLINAYYLNPEKICLLYKAVDLSKIEYKAERSFALPIKILFVKADYVRGGLPVLAKSLKKLNHIQFLLTIIGPHHKFEKHIYTLFENNSHIKINFLAEQSQKNVYEQMCTHDIFCVPSLKEALGVANIEALAFGIPVVSTYTGGIPEVLDNGKNGWLANSNDAEDLAIQLSSCISNEPERNQKSANGRKFIEKFAANTMFLTFINIAENACKPVTRYTSR
ncbi:glycosyltransferase family 4 protein [Rhodocytophaga rosea]|uniref:Glycosyltransferase family 4 protein n=1 Tax=Rhodocytophaga rosea TaxID=2704465 RepID=A0A6C0GEI2_9BACT|nr:glycosyltransferase family 4 protein [Rhodocytophaga rosea]QHT66080.1 glycosyltransferase family 4 protein [Rhodocytophaga rosea]